MLKVMKYGLTFIVPEHWIDGWGFIKPEGVCALKVFFGDLTNEEADKELKKRLKFPNRGWYKFYVTI